MKMNKRRQQTAALTLGDQKETLHKNLEFTATEQYKLLRANLSFTLPEDEECPIIGVTSSMRGEGKSTTSVNLSYALAENGKKTLLIDGDLRLPSIAKKMDIDGTHGLTDLLMGSTVQDAKVFRPTFLNNWYILPSGNLPPNPSELLGSHRMETALKALREKFDYIVIDLPPVNLVSDVLAISKYVTGLLVVIREDYTEKKELERCFRQLELSNVKILGCVLNGSKIGKGSYSKYRYKYYKNRDYQSDLSGTE